MTNTDPLKPHPPSWQLEKQRWERVSEGGEYRSWGSRRGAGCKRQAGSVLWSRLPSCYCTSTWLTIKLLICGLHIKTLALRTSSEWVQVTLGLQSCSGHSSCRLQEQSWGTAHLTDLPTSECYHLNWSFMAKYSINLQWDWKGKIFPTRSKPILSPIPNKIKLLLKSIVWRS